MWFINNINNIISNLDITNITDISDIKILLKDGINFLFEKVCPRCPEVINNDGIKDIFKWLLSDRRYSMCSLMEAMLLIDGVVCGLYFIRDYLILVVSSKKLDKNLIVKYSEEIVKNYNNIYILSSVDRYLLYLVIFSIYNCINYFVDERGYSYILILLFVFPNIQNRILSINLIFLPIKKNLNLYIENKGIFIKYSISKLSVKCIQSLHPQIIKIQNYHIFIIYRCLNIVFVLNIVKNTLFILLLNILRNIECTYYYYKGIKLAYYHNVGYMYNVLPLDNAIFITNKIIKEKRWRECDNIEIINAFFVLLTNKYELFSSVSVSLVTSFKIMFFKLFSLWSIVSLLKMINSIQLVSGIWIYILLIMIYGFFAVFNTRNIITSLIIYYLIKFNINDLMITLVIVINKLMYYWIEEIFFFVYNINDVRKVIKSYEQNIKKDILQNFDKDYEVV